MYGENLTRIILKQSLSYEPEKFILVGFMGASALRRKQYIMFLC